MQKCRTSTTKVSILIIKYSMLKISKFVTFNFIFRKYFINLIYSKFSDKVIFTIISSNVLF